MKRTGITAGLLTVGAHAVAIAGLSLWTVGGGDFPRTPDEGPGPETSLVPSPSAAALPDTVTAPIPSPDRLPSAGDSTAGVKSDVPAKVVVRTPARTEVTPILILSWQKGGGRRKIAGVLPTLTGPLGSDVTASFKVTVGADGKVKTVKAVQGKNPAFERAALARIRQWKFEPLRASKPADQLCTVTLKAKAR